MNEQVDWVARIDAAVDRPPGGFEPGVALALGHQRLRRRRRNIAALGTAAVAGVAGALWVIPPNAVPAPKDQVNVATVPPTLLGPTPAPPEEALVRYSVSSGELVVRPGVEIVRRVGDVVVTGLDSDSIAAVVSFEGQTWWTVAGVIPGLSSWTDQHVPVHGRTFEQWVREKSLLQGGGTDGNGSWVRLDSAGELTADPGVKIVEEKSPARPDQAPADALSAAGTIEVNGARLCFVVRRVGEQSDDFYVAESEYPGCGAAVPGISDAVGASEGNR